MACCLSERTHHPLHEFSLFSVSMSVWVIFHKANDICVSSCESLCKCVDVCLGKNLSLCLCVWFIGESHESCCVKIMSSSCFPPKSKEMINNVIILRTIQVNIYIRVKPIFIIFYNLYFYIIISRSITVLDCNSGKHCHDMYIYICICMYTHTHTHTHTHTQTHKHIYIQI